MASVFLATGLLGIVLFLILLFVNAILSKSRIPSAVCLLLCFALFARGAIATVDIKRQAAAERRAAQSTNTGVPSSTDRREPNQAVTNLPTGQDTPPEDTSPSEEGQNIDNQEPTEPDNTNQPGQPGDNQQPVNNQTPASQTTTDTPTQSVAQSNNANSGNWGEDSTTDEVTGSLTRTAYWVSNGKSYHFSSNCPSLSRSSNIQTGTLQDALNAGKTDPCNNCANGS